MPARTDWIVCPCYSDTAGPSSGSSRWTVGLGEQKAGRDTGPQTGTFAPPCGEVPGRGGAWGSDASVTVGASFRLARLGRPPIALARD